MDFGIVICALAGGMYGYKRGIVSIMIKPIGRLFKLGASVLLCVPTSEFLLLPIMQMGISPLAARFTSIAVSFALILILGSRLISMISGVLTAAFNVGLIGKFNRIIGAMLTFSFSIVFILLFITIYGKINSSFDGGIVYRFLCRICDGIGNK